MTRAQRLYVGAYRRPIGESLQAVAERADAAARSLGRIDPRLGTWLLLDWRAELHPYIQKTQLLEELRAGQAPERGDGAAAPHLGSNATLVSAGPGEQLSLHISGGGQPDTPRTDSLVLQPFVRGQGNEFLWQHAEALLRALVTSWSPSAAVFADIEITKAQRPILGLPGVNLLTWRDTPAVPPGLPDYVRVEPLGSGHLFDLRGSVDGQPSPDEELQGRVIETAKALAAAGLRP